MSKSKSRFLPGLFALLMAFMLLAIHGSPAKAQDAQWQGRFWNNRDLSGEPVLTRWENTIDFRWFGGSPAPEVNDDNFSAQWTRNVFFPAGTYRFTATMDDGMRIWIDNVLIMDQWHDSQEHTATVDWNLTEGNHQIRIDYFEAGGQATAIFNWQNIGGGGGGAFFPNWRGEYFTNPNLSGAPALVRDDRYLSQNWGLGSPGPGIPADNFSARWTRSFVTTPGTYQLTLTSDDGSRIFVNDQLLLDNWVGGLTTQARTVNSNGTPLNVRVEYYELTAEASINVRLDLLSQGGVGPNPPLIPGGCTRPTGFLATVNTNTLNVRTGPSTLNEIVARMTLCQTATLTGFTNSTRDWVELVTPTGVLGWSSTQYLLLGVPTSQMQVK